ncbi:GNAT family N-acetyltransferase [Saccharothrix obliqua]|uniref:GNAT family N-acetyltransferase n=1 Tax=Saccharothrix obliqua TaxID=2861747 RepID=UPI001C5D2FF4|nr:GNAT family N-acetyltransferase [Saccharothrix obliqua]MBW4720872.1 GNAT family N-acetyltransferase [Saccharothrix obliqua]
MTITIRTPVAADSPDVVEVHVRARRSYYEGHLPEADLAEWEAATRASGYRFDRPGRVWLCADVGGVVAGFALFVGAELLQVQVDPAHWGEGVGGALHRACVAAWRAAGVVEAHLEVFEPNTRARRFYVARGWREVGVGDGPYPHVRMSLTV